jgi:hypothetical protein
MVTVHAVVSSTSLARLAGLEGVPEIMAGILVYAERHRDRLDRLQSSSYLLDYALNNMGSLDGPEEDAAADAAAAAGEFAEWEEGAMGRRLALPPRRVDGRIQVGGTAIVGVSGVGVVGAAGSRPGPAGVSSDDESVKTIEAEDSGGDDSSSAGSE